MSVAPDDLQGTEVGRYRLEGVLGEGGMGRVYLGVDGHGTRVAIKVLSEQTPELVQRFFAEARAVSLISHSNIVNLVDLSELPDGRPYMVMELVEGQTLREAAPTASLADLGRIIGEVLGALHAAHAIGIVHRDLKPDNIMVTRAGHAKVLDFGVAKLAPGVGGGLTPRTKDGIAIGTPAYMAPEQVIGGAVDARTDIYTMGVVLFEAVTGQRPFSGGTDFDVMRAHRDRPPPRPRTLRPSLPAAVEEVILRALEKHPAKRFPTASAMATALADAIAGRASTPEVAASASGNLVATVRERPALLPKAPAVAASPPPSRVPAMIGVAAIGIAATVAFVIARARRDAPRQVPADAAPTEIAVAEAIVDAERPIATVVDAGETVVDAEPLAPDAAVPDAAVADAKLPQKKTTAATAVTLPAPITRPRDFPKDAFDPVTYLGRATDLARELASDAQLVGFEARPITLSNVVDLARLTRRVEYTYLTRAGMAAAPIGGARPCLVVVSVALDGATARVVTDRRCTAKPVRAPRCSIEQVRKRVTSAYASDGYRAVELAITWRGMWSVRGRMIDADTKLELPDC